MPAYTGIGMEGVLLLSNCNGCLDIQVAAISYLKRSFYG